MGMTLESGDKCSFCGRDDAWVVEYHHDELVAFCEGDEHDPDVDPDRHDSILVEHA